MYSTTLELSLGALLAKEIVEGKGNALYCLSRTLVGPEVRFLHRESVFGTHICHTKAVVLSSAQSHQADLGISPLKYIFNRPTLHERLAKWVVLLQQYEIEYVPQKKIKGQTLVDFLAAHPVLENLPLATDFPDKEIMLVAPQKGWEMFFCGAPRSPTAARQEDARDNVVGIGILSSLQTTHSFFTLSLYVPIIRRNVKLSFPGLNWHYKYQSPV